mmetsp:Transcript_15900/g.49306  ORF Transcript_15900/g.49306 Transcript_15900/m.49306 type:complete len:206 (-) Transcript_15900:388-1005(-)
MHALVREDGEDARAHGRVQHIQQIHAARERLERRGGGVGRLGLLLGDDRGRGDRRRRRGCFGRAHVRGGRGHRRRRTLFHILDSRCDGRRERRRRCRSRRVLRGLRFVLGGCGGARGREALLPERVAGVRERGHLVADENRRPEHDALLRVLQHAHHDGRRPRQLRCEFALRGGLRARVVTGVAVPDVLDEGGAHRGQLLQLVRS